MKIFCVRIGERYGPEYEQYLEQKLPEYDFHWIREDIIGRLQWNKLVAMSHVYIEEPVIVMDIDILLLNDYKKIFEYPIKRGQFLAAPGWWRWGKYEDLKSGRFSINGGFQKFYPQDANYIYQKFMSDPAHWMEYYIKEGFTSGPVNGEQHFVEDSVNEKLELVKLPDAWFCRMDARNEKTLSLYNARYKELTGNSYMFLGSDFHTDIKFVHFTHMANHPNDWKKIKLFKPENLTTQEQALENIL